MKRRRYRSSTRGEKESGNDWEITFVDEQNEDEDDGCPIPIPAAPPPY